MGAETKEIIWKRLEVEVEEPPEGWGEFCPNGCSRPIGWAPWAICLEHTEER